MKEYRILEVLLGSGEKVYYLQEKKFTFFRKKVRWQNLDDGHYDSPQVMKFKTAQDAHTELCFRIKRENDKKVVSTQVIGEYNG